MRKTLLITLFFTFVTCISGVSLANDYQKGIYELNRGQFKAAIAEFEPLAAKGYTPAQYQLAMMYKHGQGIAKNPKKALELLSLAANQNDSDAQFDLAVLYTEGKVVAKNLMKAFILTEKAANKGLASAQFNLGVMYYHGDGVQRDLKLASRWYQKAAKQNYVLAQFNLALMYFEGQGVEKSIEKSYIWNVIASYNGYIYATKSRDMDANKMSKAQVKKAHREADEIYRKIVEQGEIQAKLAEEKSFY